MALQIATDGLLNMQLRENMKREMAKGNCQNFQDYKDKLQELTILHGFKTTIQPATRPQSKRAKEERKAQPEPQGPGRRKNSWQKRRDSEHDKPTIEDIVRLVDEATQKSKTTSETSKKKEKFKDKCFKKWEAKLKEMSGKPLAQQKQLAKHFVDKLVSEAKAANSQNLNLDVIQKFWDRQVNKYFTEQSEKKLPKRAKWTHNKALCGKCLNA